MGPDLLRLRVLKDGSLKRQSKLPSVKATNRYHLRFTVREPDSAERNGAIPQCFRPFVAGLQHPFEAFRLRLLRQETKTKNEHPDNPLQHQLLLNAAMLSERENQIGAGPY